MGQRVHDEGEEWRDQLAEIVGALPAGVVIHNHEGLIAYANVEAARILGESSTKLIGRCADSKCKVYTIDGEPLAEGPAARVLRTGRPVREEELIMERPDGTSVFVSAKSAPFGEASVPVTSVITSLTDITERKQAEREQARLRSLLDAVIKHMPVGVMVAEAPVGRLIMSNDKIEELWHEPVISQAGEPLPHRCRSFHRNGEEYPLGTCPLSRALLNSEKVVGEEMLFQCWDGARTAASVSSAPILDEAGEMIAAVAIFHEISPSKALSEDYVECPELLESGRSSQAPTSAP